MTIIERAFIAGRSKQSWESFKSEFHDEIGELIEFIESYEESDSGSGLVSNGIAIEDHPGLKTGE